MATYFTSDLHLGHEEIIAFAQRPWGSVAEHDAAIIANINETVREEDELYVLGDFTLCMDKEAVTGYLDAIRCKRRHLVIGNHDKVPALFAPGAFVECCHYKELEHGGRLWCLSHYPMLEWNMSMRHHGIVRSHASVMLHGHVHSCTRAANGDTARAGIWRYDVGVDANSYRPVSIEEISAFIAERDPLFG